MSSVKGLISTEDKLRALHRLQTIDSKIDDIKTLRGELPIEVEDLEDEIEGLNKRIGNLEAEIEDLNDNIAANQNKIKESEALIEKYNSQQKFVKNNREYDALTKELEMQKLEIELANKKIRDTKKEIGHRGTYLAESKEKRDGRQVDLGEKRKELEVIIEETKKEEAALVEESKEASADIERRLLEAYRRIRKTYRNGLAVVTVERDSCGGCFGKIPPQRQLEIHQRKKILVCEHCGRILVDPNIEGEIVDM